jgi:hypothetical protein
LGACRRATSTGDEQQATSQNLASRHANRPLNWLREDTLSLVIGNESDGLEEEAGFAFRANLLNWANYHAQLSLLGRRSFAHSGLLL